MTYDEFLADLHAQNAFQLGEFTLKSGVLSPIYIDLRMLVSSPKILASAARMLCEQITNTNIEFDYIVGVPYGAMALATLVAHFLNKPMIFKRKEAKSYGTKKLIEGIFKEGGRALIIEDVVTSGASVLETTEELRRVGLVCEWVVCVMDRESGGVDRLHANGIAMRSIISLTAILDFLERINTIKAERKAEIWHELRNPRLPPCSQIDRMDEGQKLEGPEVRKMAPPRTGPVCCEDRSAPTPNPLEWSLKTRLPAFASNALNKRIAEIILDKQTNLCLAADFMSADEILVLLEKVHPYICALKLHHDIVDGFDRNFVDKLCQLADQHNFVIFEDRKFADIGKVTELQAKAVSNWAHVITVHSVVGEASIRPLENVIGQNGANLLACLLVAELSTEGNLTTCKGYMEETVKIAKYHPNIISGFICQKRCHDDPAFLYWTPGVNLSATSDGAGQQWRSVERAIIDDGCDIIVVGRGICIATDPAAEAHRYALAGWKALMKRNLKV